MRLKKLLYFCLVPFVVVLVFVGFPIPVPPPPGTKPSQEQSDPAKKQR